VLVLDEVGHLPLKRQAANLLFALISRRYERGSIVVASNRSFEQQWGGVFGDAMVAAAPIDRLVRHATMVALKEELPPEGAARRHRARCSGSVAARLCLSGSSYELGALFGARKWCGFRGPLTRACEASVSPRCSPSCFAAAKRSVSPSWGNMERR